MADDMAMAVRPKGQRGMIMAGSGVHGTDNETTLHVSDTGDGFVREALGAELLLGFGKCTVSSELRPRVGVRVTPLDYIRCLGTRDEDHRVPIR